MGKPVIVGLGHQKNVGKDKFADFCIQNLRTMTKNMRIIRRGFVDELYHFLNMQYGWAGFQSREYYVANPKEKERKLPLLRKTPRELLIEFGDKIREIDPDFWLNGNLARDDYDFLFVNDLRYKIELNGAHARGAYLLRITRPGLPIPTDTADNGLTGREDEWTEHFDNAGTLQDLFTFSKQVAEMLYERWKRG